jgi:hypothetical protein
VPGKNSHIHVAGYMDFGELPKDLLSVVILNSLKQTKENVVHRARTSSLLALFLWDKQIDFFLCLVNSFKYVTKKMFQRPSRSLKFSKPIKSTGLLQNRIMDSTVY